MIYILAFYPPQKKKWSFFNPFRTLLNNLYFGLLSTKKKKKKKRGLFLKKNVFLSELYLRLYVLGFYGFYPKKMVFFFSRTLLKDLCIGLLSKKKMVSLSL